MCIRDRRQPTLHDDVRRLVGNVLPLEQHLALAGLRRAADGQQPVSYTHLDVYKRQRYDKTARSLLGAAFLAGAYVWLN